MLTIHEKIIILEFYQLKCKWLMLGIYKPPKHERDILLQDLSSLFDLCENIIIIGDFTM